MGDVTGRLLDAWGLMKMSVREYQIRFPHAMVSLVIVPYGRSKIHGHIFTV